MHNNFMKKVKIFVFLSIFVLVFTGFGCANREISSANVFRDDMRVGGSLSFVYDRNDRKIYVGGQDEVIQYSQGNEIFDAGTRVGLKIVAPDEKLDISTARLEMNGISYAAEDFLEKVNGKMQRYFLIYPLVSKNSSKVKFSVSWQDGVKEQSYFLQIVDGTKFMNEDGEVF